MILSAAQLTYQPMWKGHMYKGNVLLLLATTTTRGHSCIRMTKIKAKLSSKQNWLLNF